MSILGRIQKGILDLPPKVWLYGMPGVGKTSFAASAPRPILLCAEEGANQIDCEKLRVTGWTEMLEVLEGLRTEKHNYLTVAVDTLDALEAYAAAYVCDKAKKDTLADFDWGKGNLALLGEFRRLLKGLELLRSELGMGIVLVAHSHVKPFNDPTLGTYDRYTPKLNDKVAALVNEWSDCVCFCAFETGIYEKKGERNRGVVTGARVMHTVKGTGFDAKNRYSLPAKLPLDHATFTAAVKLGQTMTPGALRESITRLCVDIDLPETSAAAAAFVKTAGENTHVLAEIENKLKAKLAEKMEKAS